MPPKDEILNAKDVELQVKILRLGKSLSERNGAVRRHSLQHASTEELEAATRQLMQDVRASQVRKAFGLKVGYETPHDVLRTSAVSLVSWRMLTEQSPSTSVETVSQAVIDMDTEDSAEALLMARDALARLVIEGVLHLSQDTGGKWGGRLLLTPTIFSWITGGNKSKGDFCPSKIDASRNQKSARNEAETVPQKTKSPTARELYDRVRTEVVGLDAEVRVLASRIALHAARADALRAGLKNCEVPQMVVCLVAEAGTGKTYLASKMAAHGSIPFVAYDTSTLTSQGYVGSDLDEPYRLLTQSVGGDPAEAARGVIFLDEIDGKSMQYGLEVSGRAIQQELLCKLQATAPFQIGGKRSPSEYRSFLFDGTQTGYILAGAFASLDEVIAKKSGKSGIGFSSGAGERNHVYMQDCLIEMGFMKTFVSRIGLILRLPKVRRAQVASALGPICDSYTRILAPQGIILAPSPASVNAIADFSMETKGYYRMAKSVMSVIVEELVFDARRGVAVIKVSDVRRAIDRLANGIVIPKPAGQDVRLDGGFAETEDAAVG